MSGDLGNQRRRLGERLQVLNALHATDPVELLGFLVEHETKARDPNSIGTAGPAGVFREVLERGLRERFGFSPEVASYVLSMQLRRILPGRVSLERAETLDALRQLDHPDDDLDDDEAC